MKSADNRDLYEFDFGQRHLMAERRSRLVADNLQLLLTIEAAIRIARKYIEDRGGPNGGMLMSWDVSQILGWEKNDLRSLPTWKFYVTNGQAVQPPEWVKGLQEKLRANVEVNEATLPEFSRLKIDSQTAVIVPAVMGIQNEGSL